MRAEPFEGEDKLSPYKEALPASVFSSLAYL